MTFSWNLSTWQMLTHFRLFQFLLMPTYIVRVKNMNLFWLSSRLQSNRFFSQRKSVFQGHSPSLQEKKAVLQSSRPSRGVSLDKFFLKKCLLHFQVS